MSEADKLAAVALERDEARAQFDEHVAWASDRAAIVEAQLDKLGEALYLMSGPLRASGFLDNDENHRLYENVVAAYREVGWAEGCSDCGGDGIRFDHADDCDNDSCALNGDMDSCQGQVVQCHCAAHPHQPGKE